MDPKKLRYAKTHEWASLEGDLCIVGISQFAVDQLTDIVYIELPEVGDHTFIGDAFGEIESVKAVSDLYSPASGEVIEVNAHLPNDLDALSQDPFGRGWLMKIRLANPAEASSLLDAAAYQQQCAAEH